MGPDVEDKEQQQAKHSIWSSAVLGSKRVERASLRREREGDSTMLDQLPERSPGEKGVWVQATRVTMRR